ncbi:NAD(P)-binding protein, partial [Streptomyces sp. SID6013]|nr:NAD(P)-binding protein [Streptomyces sp. SID6013]
MIGGGIGGLTAAAALHQSGLRVTVLERAPS